MPRDPARFCRGLHYFTPTGSEVWYFPCQLRTFELERLGIILGPSVNHAQQQGRLAIPVSFAPVCL